MKPFAVTCTLILLASLAACSKEQAKQAPPTAQAKPVAAAAQPAAPVEAPVAGREPVEPTEVPKAHADALMAAIFPDKYDAAQGSALVSIAEGEEKGWWLTTLSAATALPDGRTVVVTNGAWSDEQGAGPCGSACPGLMSVYVLKQSDKRWEVVERHDGVTSTGMDGRFGSVKWIMLGPDKPGFVASFGGSYQGESNIEAEVYVLDHGLQSLGGFTESFGYIGFCNEGDKPCREVASRMRFVDMPAPAASPDIVVDFDDKRFHIVSEGKDDEVERVKSQTRQSARYHFDGKQYVLVSGTNPAPDA